MINYKTGSGQLRPFLGLTGLTAAEFRDLLPAFERAYDRAYPMDRTATDRPRQRFFGGGRHAVLSAAEDKLLFVLVYLKTYPLQAVVGQLFGLGTSQVDYLLHQLLPVLPPALDDLGGLPGRDGAPLPPPAPAPP